MIVGDREEADNDLCPQQHSISETLNFISSPWRQGVSQQLPRYFKSRSFYPNKVEPRYYYYTLCYIKFNYIHIYI